MAPTVKVPNDQLARTKRPTILIVDDEPTLRELVLDVIGGSNIDCRLITAASVSEATQAIAKIENLELVLLDLHLPDGSGMSVLPMLRELHPMAEAVVLTGHASLNSAITAMRAGVIDLLPKPFSADDLRERVRKALSKQLITAQTDRRLARLRLAVKRLNDARRLVSKKVDLLCNDLISAYGDLSKQMDEVRTREAFRKLLGDAKDLEQLLCHTMDWILRHAGYCNVAIWLASDEKSNELGAYMKYTIAGDAALTESMKHGLLPLAAQEGFVQLQPDELAEHLTPEECNHLKGQTILAANCTYLGETLATLVVFRDARSPFTENDGIMLKTISPIFATMLAASVRGDDEESEDYADDNDGEATGEPRDEANPFCDDGTTLGDDEDEKARKRRKKARDKEQRNAADWWKRGEPPPF